MKHIWIYLAILTVAISCQERGKTKINNGRIQIDNKPFSKDTYLQYAAESSLSDLAFARATLLLNPFEAPEGEEKNACFAVRNKMKNPCVEVKSISSTIRNVKFVSAEGCPRINGTLTYRLNLSQVRGNEVEAATISIEPTTLEYSDSSKKLIAKKKLTHWTVSVSEKGCTLQQQVTIMMPSGRPTKEIETKSQLLMTQDPKVSLYNIVSQELPGFKVEFSQADGTKGVSWENDCDLPKGKLAYILTQSGPGAGPVTNGVIETKMSSEGKAIIEFFDDSGKSVDTKPISGTCKFL